MVFAGAYNAFAAGTVAGSGVLANTDDESLGGAKLAIAGTHSLLGFLVQAVRSPE